MIENLATPLNLSALRRRLPLSIGLFALVVLGAPQASAADESGFVVSDNSTGVTIDLYMGNSDSLLTIPSSIGGKSVTAIGDDAFVAHAELTSVIVPRTVASIGSGAFSYCSALTSIALPDSASSLGSAAFFGCSSLQAIVLPSRITTLSADLLGDCTSLVSVGLPSALTTIGQSAFAGCTALRQLALPQSLVTIDPFAFRNCGFADIALPAGLAVIGTGAFSDNLGLKDVFFAGNAPASVGDSSFGAATGIVIHYPATAMGFTNPWCGYPTSADAPIPPPDSSSDVPAMPAWALVLLAGALLLLGHRQIALRAS